MLNLTYSLLEGEATLAARLVGLDPGLGVMHADQPFRDSLASDLMEPVRTLVDAYVFGLLTTRPFAARDFFETRSGVCRVTPPLTHELACTSAHWVRLVGEVAEDFANLLERGGRGQRGSPTPITERRRSMGRGQVPACGVTADRHHLHDESDQLAMSRPGGTSSLGGGASMSSIDSALK